MRVRFCACYFFPPPLLFEWLPVISFCLLLPVWHHYSCSDTQLEINHFTCRRKPRLFFSFFCFCLGFFFFPVHSSGAAVRAGVKVHQVSAPSPPAHPLSFAPDLYLSSPILTSVESGCFGIALPPPSALHALFLFLPPHHHSFLVKLTSNSCSSPRRFLSRCFAHTHSHTPPPATSSFPSFNIYCSSKSLNFTVGQDSAVFPQQVLDRFDGDVSGSEENLRCFLGWR